MNNNLDKLAFEFFKLYAQYESTLKEQGFFRFSNGKIFVDWDRFVNEKIGSSFLEELGENKSAAEYILDNPPMKQTVNELDQIVWSPVANTEKNVQILFSHISRVRNNLFHGAKFNGTWFDPERSDKLLSKSLIILKSFRNKV